MLVLSRKPGESFIAGECVKITVLEVSGDRIKIGIEAPPSVRIMRTEVAETEKSNMEAVRSEGMAGTDIFKGRRPVVEAGGQDRRQV